MALDPRLLVELEQHGVSNAHLEALVRFLRCEANGSFAWHAKQGRLDYCELKLSYASRGHTVQRVSEILLVSQE